MGRQITGKIVVATHNKGKLREIAALLAPHGIEAVSAAELGLPAPEETGYMFAHNAAQKAHAAARATGLPALSDDSGICIDALDGAPGLHTAEWTGQPRDYGRAMQAMHDELARRGVRADGAPTRVVSAMVVAWPDGHEELFEGRCYGHLAWPVRGTRGFGFDPIFVPEGETRTFGEMEPHEKDAISHRALAFAAFVAGCLDGGVGDAEPPRAFVGRPPASVAA